MSIFHTTPNKSLGSKPLLIFERERVSELEKNIFQKNCFGRKISTEIKLVARSMNAERLILSLT